MSTPKAGYGRRLRALRMGLGLSQRAFAQLTLSPSASARNIGRIENEEVVPRTSTLTRIAEALEADANWLVTGRLADVSVVRLPFVGDRVRRLRNELGLSQRAFAQLVLSENASARNIGRIEQGEVMPRQATLERIAEATGKSVQYFLKAA